MEIKKKKIIKEKKIIIHHMHCLENKSHQDDLNIVLEWCVYQMQKPF